MKKTCRLARYVVSLLIIACFSGTAYAAPYGPKGRVINWVQPGGEKLKLRAFGDDYYARTETEDGYTVVYNPADGAYHYAELGEKGAALKPSGIKAHLAARDGQSKHVDLPVEKARKIHQVNRTRFAGERDKRWNRRVQAVQQLNAARADGLMLRGPEAAAAKINAAPVIGDKIGLTILAQFPNDSQTDGRDPVDFPVNRGAIVDFCNQEGYSENGNTGSVRDYYYDQSIGKVTYTQKVTQIVTLPRARNYYNYDNYPTNTILRDTGEGGRMLIADAVAVLKAENFDFTGLTVDGQSNAIATNLFFAGADSGVWANGLWPHQWNLASGLNVGTATSPVYLYNYQVTNIENSSPVIGTFCHENGHLLTDYPDIYDVYGEGVGEHCLMGSGNYLNDGKTPSPINAYFKELVGWANIIDLLPESYVTETLPTTGNVAYRIRKPGTPTESFIVENRGKGDKWADYSNDKGIAIWHIDETVNGNIGSDPYMVALEQSDGAFDLEGGRNRGDSSDLFDLATPLFSDGSTPNANWWDGSSSAVRVKVVGAIGANTSVQFGKLPPDTIILDSPNGGEVMYRDSIFPIKWEANIVGSLKIDLYRGGVFDRVIATNVPNTGSFDWVVSESIPAAKSYTIRISTITNTVPVYDASEDVFTVTDATFPLGNVMPYGWYTPSDADAGWKVTQSSVYEGSHSLRSKTLGDGKTAAVSYTSDFKAGQVSFYMKVSSEVGYDYASFYIDGVRQLLPAASSKKGITGKKSWSFASYAVSAGKHTMTWTYEKDDSYGEGRDAAWVDGVLLPVTTQEISVQDKKGLEIASGASLSRFPVTRIGNQSEPVTFTIKNKGGADLHGLNVLTKGDDDSSFVIGALGKSALKPGESTTFTASFAPTKRGTKQAEIRIRSNDNNEDPFIIAIEGNALGIPEIAVFQPIDEKLKDGKGVIAFGSQTVDQTGKTKAFTVKNTGSAVLKDLKVSKSGPNKGDFDIRAIGSSSLAPGESTTFNVTFTPDKLNQRLAELHISYNYKKAGSFDIKLKGNGTPKKKAQSAIAASGTSSLFDAVFGSVAAGSPVTAPVESSTVIDGITYLSLTISKPLVADGLTGTVEVSPNLVDWFSGAKHTTIITDNEAFLKVRDNTPATPGVKRYIRLKPAHP